MKILYLSSVRIPSEKASGLAIVRQCQAFAEIGHEVTLVVPKRSKHTQAIKEVYGVLPKFTIVEIRSFHLYGLGKFGLALMYLYESARALLFFLHRTKSVDLIYARDQYLLAPFILFGFSRKCYLELHTKHTDVITKLVAKRAKKVIAISKGLKEFYESMIGRTDIQVEPSGVDLKQFENLPPSEQLRKEFGLPSNKTIFGYVGKYKTMGEEKGVRGIIEAFTLAHKQNNNIFLYLVGIEDREREEVLQIFEAEKVDSSAYLVTGLDQSKFARHLMACDVLLMNYPNTEHYAKYMSPTKLFAYMATGKPIISSDLQSVRNIVESDEILFTKPDSVEEYCDQILLVANNILDFKSRANKNKDLVLKFCWNNRAMRIVKYEKRTH